MSSCRAVDRTARRLAALLLVVAVGHAATQDVDDAAASLERGAYRDTLALAVEGLAAEPDEERWHLLAIEAHLALGEYAEARALVEAALGPFSWSLPLRLEAHEVFLRTGDPQRAAQMLDQITRQARVGSWRYRDAQSQVWLARARLLRGDDAKEVLDENLRPAERAEPELVAPRLAIAELALSKHDDQLASEAIQRALELDGDDPELHLALARAFASSDQVRTSAALERALELNPAHAEALLMSVDQLVAAEVFDEAEARLAELLATDEHRWEAWCYRAVLAHLAGDAEREAECRARALAHWDANPGVDHLIGRELSEKYRFAEGAAAQRRVLELDPDHQEARFQLAQDLLRLGDETEGWSLAEAVLADDPYNVVAYNLMVLHDGLTRYRTLEREGIVVRMDPREADTYGALVLELVERACTELGAKYALELDGPVVVELFSAQADFAIRTFGLPGGEGFLGVCFGDVVTMQSPAAQGASPSSWEATLWHELAHVITLNKTNNRMPRWLSEGISVYEERLADPRWGRPMTAAWRARILGGGATPLSAMSTAFLRPETPFDLMFAYFEAGLVVEFLVDTYGLPTLVAVLADLGASTGIDVALEARMAPLDQLDAAFDAYLRARAEAFAPGATWESIEELELADPDALLAFAGEHPDNVPGLLLAANALLAAERGGEALPLLERALELLPQGVGPGSAYELMARHFKATGDEERELDVLARWTARDADALAARERLAELQRARGDWSGLRATALGWLGVQPMSPAAWRDLLTATRSLGEAPAVVRAGRALLALEPVDPAGVHYEIARASMELGELDTAWRETLRALEEAPRYRAAHRLLLELSQPAPPPDALVNPRDDGGEER